MRYNKSSLGIIIATSIITATVTFFITSFIDNKIKKNDEDQSALINNCEYDIKRLEGYNFIKPLMFIDDECEGDELIPIKMEINNIIEKYIKNQNIQTASVYLRDLQNNKWIVINNEEKFEPGSLFKVPILIAYLKMNELNHGLLDRELLYSNPFNINKQVAYQSKTIKIGKKYKIRELLKYMIAYSDNNATALLNQNLKPAVLNKLFSDLGLEVPSISGTKYFFTAKQYSLFIRALYNAAYLSMDDSEFAAELLGQCDFKDGIVKGVPKGIKLLHKFGEAGTSQEMQLHESAIIYLKNRPYLLTVMTKGKDNKSLSGLISEISAAVFQNMLNQS
jgi:beta-lactamase class A